MAIILKANKVSLFVSSVLFVFWYHSPNVLDTLHICNISWLRVKRQAQATSVSKTSARKTVTWLDVRLCKTTVISALKQHDPSARTYSGRTQKQHPTQNFNNFRRKAAALTAAVLSSFGHEGNILSICCITGEILLDFLKVIIAEDTFITFLTDCYHVTLAGAYRSSGRWGYVHEMCIIA
jgi:hypothetical protein